MKRRIRMIDAGIGRLYLYAAIVTFQILFNIGNEYLRLRNISFDRMALGSTLCIVVSVVVALAVPRIFGMEGDRNREIPSAPGERRRHEKSDAFRYGLLALLGALNVAGRYAGVTFGVGGPLEFIGMFVGYSMYGPVMFYLFFSRAPRKSRGLLFGIALSAGMVVRIALQADSLWEAVGPEARVRILFRIMLVVAAALAALTPAAFAAAPELPRSANRTIAPERSNRAVLLRLIATCVLFYFMSGLLAIRQFASTDYVRYPNSSITPFIFLAISPLAGLLMDKAPRRSFARLTAVGAAFFLIAPALAVLNDSPLMYSVVHSLGITGLLLISVVMTLAFVDLNDSGPWWCLLVCTPFIARFLSATGVMISQYIGREHEDVLVVLAIAVAGVLYHLAHELGLFAEAKGRATTNPDGAAAASSVAFVAPGSSSLFAPSAGAASPTRETPPEKKPPENDRAAREEALRPDTSQRMREDELFARNNLSAREKEVAAELIRGHSTAMISRNLNISESTVNFHVKNILRKFNLGTRLAFLAKVREDVEEK